MNETTETSAISSEATPAVAETNPVEAASPTEVSHPNQGTHSGDVMLTEKWLYGIAYDSILKSTKPYAVHMFHKMDDAGSWACFETVSEHQVHRIEIALQPHLEAFDKEGFKGEKPRIAVRVYEDGGKRFGTFSLDSNIAEITHKVAESEGKLVEMSPAATPPASEVMVNPVATENPAPSISKIGVGYFNASRIRALADGPTLVTTTKEGSVIVGEHAVVFIPEGSPARTVLAMEREENVSGNADLVVEKLTASTGLKTEGLQEVIKKCASSVDAAVTAVPGQFEPKEESIV